MNNQPLLLGATQLLGVNAEAVASRLQNYVRFARQEFTPGLAHARQMRNAFNCSTIIATV